MSSHRLLRVRELLKRQLGETIRRELPLQEAGLISVNEVAVAPDLQNAKVFVGILGTKEQKKRALELLHLHRKRIQQLVAESVVLKYTPQLRFVIDDTVERGNRVLQILDELEQSEPDK